MSTETILLILLVVLLAGSLPLWPHSQSWGYQPTGIFTLVLVVFLVWALADGRPLFRNSGHSVRAGVQNAGDDIKATGRDVASSIRRTVQ